MAIKFFVEPIKALTAINQIKTTLQTNPRNFALFVLGINLAFRAGDLLSIKVQDVIALKAGDDLVLKEEKTGKIRRVTVNQAVTHAIAMLLLDSDKALEDYLFTGQRGRLTVAYVNRLVKAWCRSAGLDGNYGSHTLRKTWGYHQRVTFHSELSMLTDAFGHSSEKQTLHYLCIQPEERRALYLNNL